MTSREMIEALRSVDRRLALRGPGERVTMPSPAEIADALEAAEAEVALLRRAEPQPVLAPEQREALRACLRLLSMHEARVVEKGHAGLWLAPDSRATLESMLAEPQPAPTEGER